MFDQRRPVHRDRRRRACRRPSGLAATWWWPKPQVGNTHPGATSPLGMVSACAYSGAYPTGYGRYRLSTEGVPPVLLRPAAGVGVHALPAVRAPARSASTTTTSGSPRCSSRSTTSARCGTLHDEVAEPGYYAATLGSGIRCELTVGPEVGGAPLHLPRAPRRAPRARLLARRSRHRRTGAPCRCGPTWSTVAPGVAQGEIVVEGVPLAVHLECDAPQLAPDALVRPAAHGRRHPPGLRQHPAHDAAPVRADLGGPDRGGADGRAAARVLAARRASRRRRTSTRSAGRGRTVRLRAASAPRRRGASTSTRSPSTPRRRRSARSSRPRCTTR